MSHNQVEMTAGMGETQGNGGAGITSGMPVTRSMNTLDLHGKTNGPNTLDSHKMVSIKGENLPKSIRNGLF